MQMTFITWKALLWPIPHSILNLDEIQHKLAAVCNIHISIATICHALTTLILTHNYVTKAVAECDNEL
jgi:hypothetical protein